MKLETLDFRRDVDRSWNSDMSKRIEKESFKGVARFDGADGSVSLVLTDTEAKQILLICADSLERVLTQKALGMKGALQTALQVNKDAEIGKALPGSWR